MHVHCVPCYMPLLPLLNDQILLQGLGPEVVYVSGRVRRQGEMNGKSGNLNNCARQLYPVVRSLLLLLPAFSAHSCMQMFACIMQD